LFNRIDYMMDATNDTFLSAGDPYRSHDSTSPPRPEPADGHAVAGEALPAVPLGTRRLELWLPLLIIALDQITKAIVRSTVPLYSSVTVVPGFLSVTHLRNSGAAFGFLNAAEFPFKTSVIAVVAMAALIAVGWYAVRLAHYQLVARTGLALIIGGAAGNLLDRIAVGSVLDFVDVYWRTYHFWAFNVADSAITIGVAIMFLDMLGVGTDVSKAA
jgi:signal peptidase II